MKYATVYARNRSPRFYVAYWDPAQQKRVFEVTPFLMTDPQGRRKAQDYANEKSRDAQADKATEGQERWENWVLGRDSVASDKQPLGGRVKVSGH